MFSIFDSNKKYDPYQKSIYGKRRLNIEQLNRLIRCENQRDHDKWNKWRKDNPKEQLHLEGADLSGLQLQYFDLSNACMTNVILYGTDLYRANLEEAWLQTAYVDNRTSFWRVIISKRNTRKIGTNLRGVPIESTRVDPSTRQKFEYNVRRMSWEEWYREGNFIRKFLKNIGARAFWTLSDYGMSTVRLMFCFSFLSLAFAGIYFLNPEMVIISGNNLGFKSFVHAVYFSVVTMTTLGFGDIHANPDSTIGQVLLTIHVIFGYTLLGALITRLNILFTTGSPRFK